jgi:hypothetical protein
MKEYFKELILNFSGDEESCNCGCGGDCGCDDS